MLLFWWCCWWWWRCVGGALDVAVYVAVVAVVTAAAVVAVAVGVVVDGVLSMAGQLVGSALGWLLACSVVCRSLREIGEKFAALVGTYMRGCRCCFCCSSYLRCLTATMVSETCSTLRRCVLKISLRCHYHLRALVLVYTLIGLLPLL